MKDNLLFKEIDINSYFKFNSEYFNRCYCKEEDIFPIYIKTDENMSLCYFCRRSYATDQNLEVYTLSFILI